MNRNEIKTIGDLRKSGYAFRSVKDEMRANLIGFLQEKKDIFPGIIGYDETVIPELKNAILSRHDFILLGLRGQAKTRILRSLVNLLDEYIPFIENCEINDHPFSPICKACREKVESDGDNVSIQWMHRDQRYNEKLATPDVSISDLFGDIDPIKAATRRLHYAHEGAIHFGIIPRTNRGIFVINELPDLQPRIQVGLLNILEEKDLQIRGFPLRIPLDILIAFSANPEDYTNRGNIITPLKDRIDSQIITHYPKSSEIGMAITEQEAWQDRGENNTEMIPYYFREIIEQIAIEARSSELVDQKSGVSARLPISCIENLISAAEHRSYEQGNKTFTIRITDLYAVIPAITGKIELVYEGEQEGVINVARILIGKAIRTIYEKYFPTPGKKGKDKKTPDDPDLAVMLNWFSQNNMITVDTNSTDEDYIKSLCEVKPIEKYIRKYFAAEEIKKEINLAVAVEFVLEALHQSSFLSKFESDNRIIYKDLVESIFNSLSDEEDKDLNLFA